MHALEPMTEALSETKPPERAVLLQLTRATTSGRGARLGERAATVSRPLRHASARPDPLGGMRHRLNLRHVNARPRRPTERNPSARIAGTPANPPPRTCPDRRRRQA